MDEDLAAIVGAAGERAAADLGDLVRLLGEDERELKHKIASIIYDIMQEVVSPAVESSPNLKAQVERRLEKFGRGF
jgi:hypothetical protein